MITSANDNELIQFAFRIRCFPETDNENKTRSVIGVGLFVDYAQTSVVLADKVKENQRKRENEQNEWKSNYVFLARSMNVPLFDESMTMAPRNIVRRKHNCSKIYLMIIDLVWWCSSLGCSLQRLTERECVVVPIIF